MSHSKSKVFLLIVVLAALALLAASQWQHDETTVFAQEGGEAAQSSAPVGGSGAVTPAILDEPLPNLPDAPDAIADWRVSGTALRPRSDDVSYIPTAGGGCFYASAGNSFRVFNTPVSLPQGSEILALRMYYDDTSSSNSRAWFSIYDLYGGLVQEWSVDSVGNTGNGFNDTAAINHTVDYGVYSYVINWRPYDLGSDTQLCGFRIFYEPPPFGLNFAPTMLKNP